MGMLMFRRFLILIAFSILIVAGCGDSGPKMARVEGTVTYDGKPLSAATIIFTPESGVRMGEGGTDEQDHYYLGTYKIDDGAIVGKHRVAVVKRGPYRSPPKGTPGWGVGPGGLVLADPPLIAERFLQTETSGLSADVEDRRKNVIDFELKSDED